MKFLFINIINDKKNQKTNSIKLGDKMLIYPNDVQTIIKQI